MRVRPATGHTEIDSVRADAPWFIVMAARARQRVMSLFGGGGAAAPPCAAAAAHPQKENQDTARQRSWCALLQRITNGR